jgi:sugar phosphate isomerase/epimerase
MSMMMTRRKLAAALGAAAASRAAGQQPPAEGRRLPPICLFSKHLQKLHYSELGPTLKELGFDGCDLTVRPGGHVLPERAAADLLRAIESIRGEDLEVPMITTAFTSGADPNARLVLAIAGGLKVPYFKPGYWRYTGAGNIESRLAQVRLELSGLVSLARAYGVVTGFHNHSGDYVGQAVWDTQSILAGMDPRWVGYYFDPGHATTEGGLAGWNISLRLALPRLKMVAMKDFYWAKVDGRWRPKSCPMGEGMVDWPKVFSMLAAARFTGPLSLHMEYNPADELAAIARDLAFVKKQLAAAYGNST